MGNFQRCIEDILAEGRRPGQSPPRSRRPDERRHFPTRYPDLNIAAPSAIKLFRDE